MHPNEEASIYTAHEIDRNGKVARVYHRTDSGSSWTHVVGETHRYWTEAPTVARERGPTDGCRCSASALSFGLLRGVEAPQKPTRPLNV